MSVFSEMSRDTVPKKIQAALLRLGVSAVAGGYLSRTPRGKALFTCWDVDGKVVLVLQHGQEGWVRYMTREDWLETLRKRIEASGDSSPGAFNLAADLLAIAASEANHFTKRFDDASRIPDLIYDGVNYLRAKAKIGE